MNRIKKGVYQSILWLFCILLTCTVCLASDMTYGGTVDEWGNVWIIKDSDRRIIDASEVSWMNDEQRQMAINEIYARRGRKFAMDNVRQYFENQQWYVGVIEPENFTDSMLSEIERTNIEIIKNTEYQEIDYSQIHSEEYFHWGGAYRNEASGMMLCIAEVGYSYFYSVYTADGVMLNYEENASVIDDVLTGYNYNVHKCSDGSLQVITVEAEDYGCFYKINNTDGCDSWFEGNYIAADGYITLKVYDQMIDRNDENLPGGSDIAAMNINAEHDFSIDVRLYTQNDGSLAIVDENQVIGNIVFQNEMAHITGSDLADVYVMCSESDVQRNEVSSSISIVGEPIEREEEVDIVVEEYNSATEELPIYSMEYLNEYIDTYEIDIPKVAKKNKMDQIMNDNSSPVFLQKSSNKYSLTIEETSLLYIGDTKDNKPHGWGKVYKLVSGYEYEDENGIHMEFDEYYTAENDTDIHFVLVYVGQFEEGYYEGYGWEYVTPFTNSDELSNSIYGRNLGEDYVRITDDIDYNIMATCNPVGYMGEFKKGEYHGDGIRIQYAIREIPYHMNEQEIEELFGYRIDREISITIGEYKKGIIDGEVKEYLQGHLYYSGEMKKGKKSGNGTLYYMGTDMIQYKGEWKSGKYDGKGTLYDEVGNKIYSGEWNLGDYAS